MLLHLAVILVAAKVAAEVCERIAVPAVVGEILVGIAIGPSLLGWVPADDEIVVALAELGVLLLLVQVGLEMDLAELGKVGRASLLVAVVGVVAPFVLGVVTGLGFGESGDTALFVGAALTATSVGITARVFGDLKALATTEARIVLGAAVADDVLGLLILTVVVKVVTEGSVSPGVVAETVGIAAAFLVVAGLVGVLAVPAAFARLGRHARSSATVVVLAFAVTLLFSWAATKAKLAAIIGAFVAGLALGRGDQHARVEREFGATANLFIPVFFVQIGLDADVEAMVRPAVLGLAGALVVVAIVGKLVSSAGAVGVAADKALIGIGMIPRGEVGIIFASIGLTEGILGDDQYAALLVMILVTTLVTPPLLRWRIAHTLDVAAPAAGAEGDWELAVVGDRIVLRGDPGSAHTVPIALDVARRATAATPDASVVEWFGRHRLDALTWRAEDTASLIAVLRDGDARSWRFLDVTGVLERALPEVAAALARRRADVGELDPTRLLSLPTVERLSAGAPDGAGDDVALLGALVVDVCETGGPACTAALADRLDPAGGSRIVAAVEGAALLHASLGDARALEPPRVLQLAEHLTSPATAEQAYRLAAARLDTDDWRREELDALHTLIGRAFTAAARVDGASSPADARRHAALGMLEPTEELARLRVAAAPRTFLFAAGPAELVRQARLVEPLPSPAGVRVAVAPGADPDLWRVDVTCRDRRGLLSRLARVLADAGLDVVSGSIATWPDGGVLDSFEVRSETPPDAAALTALVQRALQRRVRRPDDDVGFDDVSFDDVALPWHTLCDVSGPDRPGALAALTWAFERAGLDVHAAHLGRDPSGTMHNRFELTDRHGRKLDRRRRAAVESALAGVRSSAVRGG